MKVSIKDISERTGFSPATVSNALNTKKGSMQIRQPRFSVWRKRWVISVNRVSGKSNSLSSREIGLIIDDTPFFFTSDRRNRERVPGIGDGDGAVPPEL